ncbi:MAG: SDR family oxidoreductase [Congregibacter sp.]
MSIAKTNEPVTVFVTGATGKIGRDLVKIMAKDAETGAVQLRLGVREIEKAQSLLGPGITAVPFDFDHPERHQHALGNAKRLLLLTGYTVDMLTQAKSLIDAAKKTHVEYLVHIGAYSTPDTGVAHLGWHQLIEAYIERSGLNWTHLRPNWFMQNTPLGPDTTVFQDGILYGFLPAERKVSWISTGDIAAVAATVLRSPERHINRSYPLAREAKSYAEISDLLSECVGKPVRYQQLPIANMLAGLIDSGMEPVYATSVVEVARLVSSGGMPEANDVDTAVLDHLIGSSGTSWGSYIAQSLPRNASAAALSYERPL